MWTPPTTSEFQIFFARDFWFAPLENPNDIDLVMVSDIDRAIIDAQINFNYGLFGTEAQATNVFMYLTAFQLVRNIQMSTKGLSSQCKFPVSGNSVGGVSVNYVVPESYQKDPYIMSLMSNAYGMRYLELVLPLLVGNVQVMLRENRI